MIKLPAWGPHAELKKIQHGIEEKDIADAWVFGEVKPGNGGCWRLIGPDVTLVVSTNGEFIITMYPNKFGDRFAAERVKNAMKIGATRFEEGTNG